MISEPVARVSSLMLGDVGQGVVQVADAVHPGVLPCPRRQPERWLAQVLGEPVGAPAPPLFRAGRAPGRRAASFRSTPPRPVARHPSQTAGNRCITLSSSALTVNRHFECL